MQLPPLTDSRIREIRRDYGPRLQGFARKTELTDEELAERDFLREALVLLEMKDDAFRAKERAEMELKALKTSMQEPVKSPDEPEMTVLDEAAWVVDGPRQAAYGHPYNNHGMIAQLWTVFLSKKYPGIQITAEEMCLMMILMKIARQSNGPKRDNLTDICGYARNIEMVQEYEAKLKAD